MNILIDNITIDAALQNRARMDQTVVDEYAARMTAGDVFPPVILCGDYLVDGFHRYYAARDAGRTEIEAQVVEGETIEDARWHSITANKTHGLRRTNQDKRRATMIAIQHPRSADASNRAIAEHVGVSEGLVRRCRDDLSIPATPVVVGRDGVSRNVEVQRGQPEPPALSSTADLPEDEPVDNWSDEARQIVAELRRIKSRISRCFHQERNDAGIVTQIRCDEPGLASLPISRFKADIQNCIVAIERNAVPHIDCPLCQQNGCDSCSDRGWMSHNQYRTVPEELRG